MGEAYQIAPRDASFELDLHLSGRCARVVFSLQDRLKASRLALNQENVGSTPTPALLCGFGELADPPGSEPGFF